MIALLLALVLGVAHAAGLSLSVDSKRLAVGQTVTLQVQLVDAVGSGVPAVPVGDGLSAQYAGQSQTRAVVNFQSSRITRYSYSLTALAEGAWKIGPVTLSTDGGTMTAAPIEVVVGPREQAAASSREVTGALSDARPFLGEVVVYRFRFRYKGRIYDGRWTPPTFDGFVEERVAEKASREYDTEIDGESWSVQEYDVPLVAAGEGSRAVPPGILTVQVPKEGDSRRRSRREDPFFGSAFDRIETTTDTLSTAPIPVTVRPLPTEGRPADFSGLVGTFRVGARVFDSTGRVVTVDPDQPTRVPLGESITLELTVAGNGTLSGFKLPPPPQGAGYRAYDDEPDVVARVDDGQFKAVATFKRAIVPEAEGPLDVRGATLTVFDPEREAYVTLRAPDLRLEVTPGEAGAGEVASYAGSEGLDRRREVEAVGDDILPVPADVSVRNRTLQAALPVAVGLPAVPALALVGLFVAGRLRDRRPDPRSLLRGRLATLPADPAARLAALEDLFREAAGLRLGRPAPGLERGHLSPLGPDAVALYADLERARYAGWTAGDGADGLEARVRAFVEAT